MNGSSADGESLLKSDLRNPAVQNDLALEIIDSELMLRIADRDEAAFELLYHRYSPTLYGLCLRILKSDFDAREALSDVFIEIWENPHRYNVSHRSARGYLMSLTRCRSIDRLRLKKSRLKKQSQFHTLLINSKGRWTLSSAYDDVALDEERAIVQQAIERLTDLQRESLFLAYFEGKTQIEIASALDAPLGTIKTAMRRGLLRLKDLLSHIKAKEF